MLGSKIDNLKKLKKNGFRVPDFEVIKFADLIDGEAAFQEFCHEQLDKPTKVASDKITGYLCSHLRENCEIKLKAKKYAVRSSSNIEDGQSDSFAGQFKTFLDVNEKDLPLRIVECMLSLGNESVVSYIKQKKIELKQVSMNVLIQEMVEPDCAGVIFTANPQGLLNEMVITVGEGVGENVVAEKVESTSYYYNRTDKVYYFDGTQDFLGAQKVDELVATAQQIEGVLGENLDIEFAIKGGQIYILQARPITTLKTDSPLVFDNSNIVESYPGISLPLTASFAEMIYSGVFEAECRRILKSEKELAKHADVFSQMVGSCNGRMYYKISNWYELVHYLPFSKKIIPMWEEMLGLKNNKRSKSKVSLRLHARVARNFLKELRQSQKNMAWLNDYFIKVEQGYRDDYSDELNLRQTLALFHKLSMQLFPHWDLTLVNDMYAFINVGLLKKRLGDKANDVISGITNLESMKPVESLICLAYDKDKISSKEYKVRFAEYIQKYGDRNVEELKLESETFRTNPKLLEQRIEDYRSDMKNLERLKSEVDAKGNKRKKKISPSIYKLTKRCESGIRNREISRLNRSRIFGMVRELMLHIGKLLAEQGAIEKTRDIFYLRIEEIEKYAKRKTELKSLISERKAQYQIFEQLPAYSKLIFAECEFDKLPTKLNAENRPIDMPNKIHGTPCSSGEVSGEALVIDSPSKKYDTAGKILITRSTDPGWVFMLSTAKGIISERGSLLSHTAIISRELKIPSVVGVKDATKIIKTGDRITINGKTGEIKLKEKK